MITFTELLKRAKAKNIVVYTPTEKQAITLLKAVDKKGYRWASGTKPSTETYYKIYEGRTCYDFELKNQICYGSLSFYQKEGYTIIEFRNIDFEEE